MNNATARYFAEKDNRPPPGVKRMTVRRTERHHFGPYTVVMETSCGSSYPRVAGSVKLQLYDVRIPIVPGDKAPPHLAATKRFTVSDWREAHEEMRRLEYTLQAPQS